MDTGLKLDDAYRVRDTAKTVFSRKLERDGSAYGENFVHFQLQSDREVILTTNHVKRVILGPTVGRYFQNREEAVAWCCSMQARKFPVHSVGWLVGKGCDGKTWKRALRSPIVNHPATRRKDG